MTTFNKALSYKDISLVPRVISEQEHRDGDTSIECFGIKLDLPLISSPMSDVTNGEMAHKLSELGALGIVHRFQTIEEQVKEFNNYKYWEPDDKRFQSRILNIACAIGVTGDYQERFKELYNAGCRIFCLDTANGANRLVEKAVKWIREWEIQNGYETLSITQEDYLADKVYIIAGNVCSKEGYHFLADLGVNATRIGIAVGNQCLTRTETGVYYPMVSSILECVEERRNIARKIVDEFKYPHRGMGIIPNWLENYKIWFEDKINEEIKKLPLIIADGGIKEPQDMNKALIFADLVMAGSIFVPTDESPAEIIKFNNQLYKKYRGAASFGVQKEHTGEKPKYSEGDETLIPYTPNVSVSKVISRYKAGLQSAMSYFNSSNLSEFRHNVTFAEI